MAERGFRINRPIAFVGMMGAGKSTIGEKLALRLSLPFADSDQEIERQTGKTIGEIFELFEEEGFRERERAVIDSLTNEGPKVIATGGGAFADERSRRILLERCLTIWLDVPVDQLAQRVGGTDARPLLRGEDPHQRLARLSAKRLPFYEEAHLRIGNKDVSPDAAVELLVDTITRLER
jgi:shikimate kinase